MNLFQTMAITALISGLVVSTAFADGATTQPGSSTDTTSSPDTIHIGETYNERLQREMDENNARAQAQAQQAQGERVPQSIGKPVEIDGVQQQ